ncbi:MAG: MFS transporter [Candidatus Eremiobacteraeota bacterium]|nr:MFS transporter [Candidatus Eremiobacteraeota bacterium]
MIRRLIPILGITFIDIVGFSMLIPLLPYFATHFHASPLAIGVLFSTFSFCQLLAGPLWGNLSDRIGRKSVLVISQIGATIGWAMLGFAPTMLWVFIARIIEGVSGGNIGVTQAYVADLVAPKERARAFGYIAAAFGAGMVFGPLIGIVSSRFGFSAPFFVAAALQLLTLVLTLWLLPESRSKEERNVVGLKELAGTFHDPQIARVLYQKLALSLGLYAWFGVWSLFLITQLHFGIRETYMFFTLVSILGVGVNGFLVGRASDALGDRMMSNIGLACLIGAFLLVPLVHGLTLLPVLAILFSVGMGFANTGITALVSNSASDRQQGTVLGVSSSLDSFAGVVSPLLSTGALSRFGSPYAGVVSAVFAVIALAMGIGAGRTESRARNRSIAELTAEAEV